MNVESPRLTESDFLAHIAKGAARLTPAEVYHLIADLPDLEQQFQKLRDAGYPEAERQMSFLAHVVETVWTDRYRDMSYGAALDAAFAISYFVRECDLIPDSIGALGLVDDIAVAQTVLLRHAAEFEAFCLATKYQPGCRLGGSA